MTCGRINGWHHHSKYLKSFDIIYVVSGDKKVES